MELKIDLAAVQGAVSNLDTRLELLRSDVLTQISDAVSSLEGQWEGSKTAEIYASINSFKDNIAKIDEVITSVKANVDIYSKNVHEIDTKTTLNTQGGN